MKKLISILFATLILLSGMHLSIATHWCGGEVSQVKFSFAHENATCGMCGEDESTPLTGVSTEGCCKDVKFFFVVDSNFSPSIFHINQPTNLLLQVFEVPKTIGILPNHTNSFSNTNVRPLGNYIVGAVSLPDICVFRI
jgi:hypothetical protein